MNKRIEYLYDRDHIIGHSYFIQCNTIKDIENVFLHDIIPLLQEYFYNDWEKINLIFHNNGFIKPINADEKLFYSDDVIDHHHTYYEVNKEAFIKENFEKIYDNA